MWQIHIPNSLMLTVEPQQDEDRDSPQIMMLRMQYFVFFFLRPENVKTQHI